MTATRATILVVEDEPEMRGLLEAVLAREDYQVVAAATGRRGAIDAGNRKPDLAIVDLGLPDMDGVELIGRVREWSTMPILVLSARTQERAKIDALDAGADDYVTKPFAMGELLARVRVALRHRVRAVARLLRIGTTVVDLDARTALREGAEVHLTPVEFRLLTTLARHGGLVATHRALLRDVWGPTHEADTHYLRIYMKQLRDKLEPDPLRPRHFLTETGVGYRFVADEAYPARPER